LLVVFLLDQGVHLLLFAKCAWNPTIKEVRIKTNSEILSSFIPFH